jgi:peptide subunit release factor 1 (eRF1)
MISKTDLAPVTEYKMALGRVLSVYLDVDQAHAENLNRKFELAFESKIKDLGRVFEEDYEQRDFEACVSEVRKVLHAYEPRARGLVIFARSTGSIWMRELNVPVATEVFWGSTAHVQQFLEALNEFETYGVVLTDRAHSRIFTVKLGTIEKHAEIHAMQGVRHLKTAGTDHLYSQSHLQNKADEHTLSHLKRVAELLDHFSKFKLFHRIVLAGSSEATSELFRLLPKAMRPKVIASAALSANAAEAQVVEEVLFLGGKAERAHELETVDVLITASAKANHGVATVPETLAALNNKRVRNLVYAEGVSFQGGVCRECNAIFPTDLTTCEFCGIPVNPDDDLIEAIIVKALSEGATIEQVHGEAANKLKLVGGIGAFLRY